MVGNSVSTRRYKGDGGAVSGGKATHKSEAKGAFKGDVSFATACPGGDGLLPFSSISPGLKTLDGLAVFGVVGPGRGIGGAFPLIPRPLPLSATLCMMLAGSIYGNRSV